MSEILEQIILDLNDQCCAYDFHLLAPLIVTIEFTYTTCLHS